MVELLWRWVLKINARAVFLLALMLLCVTLVVMLHQGSREWSDLKMPRHLVYGATGAAASTRPSMAPVSVDQMKDPFTSVFLTAWLDLEASRKREREAAPARLAAIEPHKPSVAEPNHAPAVGQPAQSKWVGVTYLGMIARTDGSRVALVREVEGGRQYTLAVGDLLEAGRVADITAERVMLKVEQGEDERETPLRVGVVSRVRKDGP